MSIEDMEKELLEAGYLIEGRIENWWYEVEILTPDNWYIESQAYLGGSDKEAQEEAEADTIPRAYRHLQEKRQSAAMRDLLIELEAALRPSDTSGTMDKVGLLHAKIVRVLGEAGQTTG